MFLPVPAGSEGCATGANAGHEHLHRATGPRARNPDRSRAWSDREECARLSSRGSSACAAARRNRIERVHRLHAVVVRSGRVPEPGTLGRRADQMAIQAALAALAGAGRIIAFVH